jgi:hypothetical protein
MQAERAGFIISGGAHAAIFSLILLTGLWHSKPDPIDLTSVTLVSAADFDAQQSSPPTPPADAPATPTPPTLDSAQTPPPPAPEAPLARAERIAPNPITAPVDDTPTADTQTDAAIPDPTADKVATEPAEQTKAPTPTAPQIVPEAPKDAILSARPPKARPERPTPPTPTAEPQPEQTKVAEDPAPTDTAEAAEAETPNSQPLSASQTDGFLREVGACWNLGAASTSALRTKVTIRFDLAPDGTIIQGSMEMVGYDGGDAGAAQIAYRTARSAIFRCQKRDGRAGYTLPRDQYEQWKTIELTFNPDKMRAL